ncbi:c-type cytochrome [Cellulophaga sp. Hel_I_12]|uniref:c-type cytochrome n=1 Tax=Cellulophaga sp. Hel_I_12 TaxID=1249972 RepID=UPI00068E4C31|nr:c-type cytochrome [Cellulophaga sp. Hel_I_12]
MLKPIEQVLLFIFFIVLASCAGEDSFLSEIEDKSDLPSEVWEIIPLPKSSQRSGDAQKGKEYLFSGDYMSSGIPLEAFLTVYGANNENILNRSGDNATIPHDYTALLAENNVKVVAPNCLSCHSAKINNEYIVGLGNHSMDLTFNRAALEPILTRGIIQIYGEKSPEFEAYQQFRKSIIAIGPKTITETLGANSANKIAEVLVAHRDKNTLVWEDTPFIEIEEDVIPSDVPAWWLLKKKNAIFYTALSRGDFAKSFIEAGMLALKDVEKAKEIDQNMPDVLAYFESLEAPKYPFTVDNTLVNKGKAIFTNSCSSCHGNYGDQPSYPNSLVGLKTIKTDPELSNRNTKVSSYNRYFYDWFNTGYFGTEPYNLVLKADGGYIAPPLDGIWATAPYLHNGSVPTLLDLLHSANRPELWSRTFDNADYDTQKVGWNYTLETSKDNNKTYNTNLKGYGNDGHTFGDNLSDEERLAVLEYLKTL